jgi:hypothetical protein
MDSLIILPTKEPDMTFHLDSTLKRISEPTKKLLSVIKSEDNTPSTEPRLDPADRPKFTAP